MQTPHGRYILLETTISIFINIVISALFVLLVFGHSDHIDLWGLHGFAMDYLPQTFMISLMSVIVPTFLTRRRLRTGRMPQRESALTTWLPANMILRGLLLACIAALILGAVAVWITASLWPETPDYTNLLLVKLAYGAVVASILTPIGLLAALSDARP